MRSGDDVEPAGPVHGPCGLAALRGLPLDDYSSASGTGRGSVSVGLICSILAASRPSSGNIGGLGWLSISSEPPRLECRCRGRHLRGDRDRAGHDGFGDDIGSCSWKRAFKTAKQLPLAGAGRGGNGSIAVRWRKAIALGAVLFNTQASTSDFRSKRCAQHRLQPRLARLDSARIGGVLSFLRAIDLVVLIEGAPPHVGLDFPTPRACRM